MSSTREQARLEVPVMLRFLSCCLLICLSNASDALVPGDCLYNNETLVSEGGVFELGFFVSDETSNHYLGIWFKKDKTKKPVWVAYRDSPLIDSSGALKIREDGNLVLFNSRMNQLIVNYGSLAPNSNTTAKLIDSGNFVLLMRNRIVWQSFDYPTDTFLPGMKLGMFNLNETVRYLVSWLSPSVPTSGPFALGMDPGNVTQLNIWYSDRSMNIGNYDGHAFRFLFLDGTIEGLNFSFISNENETYLTFNNGENSTKYSWIVLSSNGDISKYRSTEEGISVVKFQLLCDRSSCFNYSMPVMCEGDDFSQIQGSMPASLMVSRSNRLGLRECEAMCTSNCSCTAFASLQENGIGCELYYGDKTDLLKVIGEGNMTINVRGSVPKSDKKITMEDSMQIIIPSVSVLLLTSIASCCLCWRKYGSKGDNMVGHELGTNSDNELALLSFSCILKATDSFSIANKLGEGGFGPVYKGKLSGQEIAVKRLSKSSGQGSEEFKNEMQLISKLQHRNLVKLLGCCVEQGEKILIYEFMTNKSLDSFIFCDSEKRSLIDWRQRLLIVEGIAQGLLYLHKYSRVTIIHRDLKTSNILLDNEMNPKISDFGMARIISGKESKAKTRRVVGTYGYMSPEYGIYGFFSVKSDVFSFGVILLEIVSGRKNVACCDTDNSMNLLGHAWDLWNGGRCMELLDPILKGSFSMNELILCIQVALLCVQDKAEDRPNMSEVVSILSNGANSELPAPKQPAFSAHLGSAVGVDHTSRMQNSANLLTVSIIEPR